VNALEVPYRNGVAVSLDPEPEVANLRDERIPGVVAAGSAQGAERQ